ncbi:cytidylyltransferase domain-containing protein [Calditrichota bacterium]
MNATVIIAARMDSSRLPGKAMMTLSGLPMIVFLIRRLKTSKMAKRIVLATTERQEDDILALKAKDEGIDVYRGSEHDVMDRYVGAVNRFGGEYVVRVTADCPFVDGQILDYCLDKVEDNTPFDLATTKGLFPQGIDFEIYNSAAMAEVFMHGCPSVEDREHLTLFMYRHEDSFRIVQIDPPEGLERNGLTFTVDTLEDYEFAATLMNDVENNLITVRNLIQKAKYGSQILETIC